MPKYAADTFKFQRDYAGVQIIVTATFIPSLEVWGLLVTVDGEPTNFMQSIDPWADARAQIDAELMQMDLEAGGVPSGLILPPRNPIPAPRPDLEE